MIRTVQFLLAIIILALTSCATGNLGRKPVPGEPYVVLSDSTVIHAKEVGMERSSGRILVDTLAYRYRDVDVMNTGDQIFAKVEDNKFGPLTAEGRINVYANTNAEYYGHPEFSNHLYIQDSSKSNIYPLTYHNLKPMIPPTGPAAEVMRRFRMQRAIGWGAMAVSIATMFAGINMAGAAILSDDKGSSAATGATIMFTGMGLTFVSVFPLAANKVNLRRAVALRNRVKPW